MELDKHAKRVCQFDLSKQNTNGFNFIAKWLCWKALNERNECSVMHVGWLLTQQPYLHSGDRMENSLTFHNSKDRHNFHGKVSYEYPSSIWISSISSRKFDF